tara:strand:+ start:880 stop:1116 length:237 start_codon:yes stop_codon:yes gene_type:complete
MAIQADNETPPRRQDEVIANDYTINLVGLETTRQYRFNKENSLHDKDKTQCPTTLVIRGPATLRGRNEAYKVEVSNPE